MSAPAATDGRVRLGGPVAKRKQRARLRQAVEQHLAAHPGTWLSAVDLARLLRDRYLDDPVPVSCRGYRYGRSNIVMKILRELAAEGAVASRPHPGRRGATQWSAAPSVGRRAA